ncbi:MAG: sulfatase-like hydrolase/transferase, partial [Planctomycetales bacterium]
MMKPPLFSSFHGLSVAAFCWIALTVATAAAAERRPNILFAIADDASYPHMGAYGCEWVKTPAFDRVANQGLLFTRAYTPNAKCAP